MSNELKSSNLVARLRERLITVPKPGSKPFEPSYPITHTWTPGEKHKPGDSAGILTVNVSLTAASSVPSKFMAQEYVYAPAPLEWDAAAEIERLQSAITQAMDQLSNGDVEGGARVLRECFWRAAPESRDG